VQTAARTGRAGFLHPLPPLAPSAAPRTRYRSLHRADPVQGARKGANSAFVPVGGAGTGRCGARIGPRAVRTGRGLRRGGVHDHRGAYRGGVGTRWELRRRTSRRSTLAGVGGLLLVALGVVLTLAHVAGNVVPTVLAIAGVGSLMAGVATGSMLVLENFRLHRDQSYYDED